MASSTQKFLFDTSFEGRGDSGKSQESKVSSDSFSDFMGNSAPAQPIPEEVVEPEAVPLPEGAVSLEDLEAEKQAAYAEGFAAGQIDAQNHATETAEALLAQSINQMSQQLQTLQTTQQSQVQELQNVSMEVALTAVKKLFPSLVNNTSLDEIILVFRECLDRLPQEPRLVIRVSDRTLDDVQKKLEEVAKQSGFNGNLVFLSEPGMPAGDVRVEWAEGGAERTATELLQEIETIINRTITNFSLPGAAGKTSTTPDTNNLADVPTDEMTQ
ncbi:FliH/SctL family protein [Kiloniella sp. EL199]|uniref:FliH/SctL family protein n=1 Tax=Kiloniella sp. EL199 TaxID=2107581 RepID=UPI000EA0B9DF|nr:FliH/SctL family protein [Kiloniella sp. EL199]